MIEPLSDKVLVEPIEAPSETPGGLLLPDSAKEKPREGIVLAVGLGRRSDEGYLVPMELKKGDKVLYTKYGGNEVEMNGKKLLMLRETDILARIK